MKVYIHYNPSSEGEALGAYIPTTLAIKLPNSWLNGDNKQILTLFLSHYQKKLMDNNNNSSSSTTPIIPLVTDIQQWYIISAKQEHLPHATIIQDYIHNGDDIYIQPGTPPNTIYISNSNNTADTDIPSSVITNTSSKPLLYCRNFGCMKQYRESENHETACIYHNKPPLFHETKKSWTCCPNEHSYDWDDFVKIPGCTRGYHSIEDPKIKLAISPTVLAANNHTSLPSSSTPSTGTGGGPSSTIKSIESYNIANPDAVSATSSVVKTLAARPKAIYRLADNKYKCVRKGCSQWFTLSENSNLMCTHHSSGPIFHDAQKSWSCCKKTAFEFDDFVNIPGCTTIVSHDPGEITNENN